MSTLRKGTKVRVTSGPSKGQTGRIVDADAADPTYLVHIRRGDRLVEIPRASLKTTW
ncbi:KOW motif-containing protein [Promicromonospora sp. NFX87]|uniref:KOW motif-containing protein n=1 Tax=Promicromonospora sp. NFX87 TaxID=3402691 RepID=UPI003AFB4CCF